MFKAIQSLARGYVENVKYKAKVIQKERLTQVKEEHHDYFVDQAVDVVYNGKEKPSLLYMDEDSHFSIISPEIKDVEFKDDNIEVVVQDSFEESKVLLKTEDQDLVDKLKDIDLP